MWNLGSSWNTEVSLIPVETSWSEMSSSYDFLLLLKVMSSRLILKQKSYCRFSLIILVICVTIKCSLPHNTMKYISNIYFFIWLFPSRSKEHAILYITIMTALPLALLNPLFSLFEQNNNELKIPVTLTEIRTT